VRRHFPRKQRLPRRDPRLDPGGPLSTRPSQLSVAPAHLQQHRQEGQRQGA